jgi:hypothetical protein
MKKGWENGGDPVLKDRGTSIPFRLDRNRFFPLIWKKIMDLSGGRPSGRLQ